MIEILINEFDWASKQRLKEIKRSLVNSGWKIFGNNGTVVFFKDVTLDQARKEMNILGITELEPEEWHEELYFDNIF